MGMPITQLVKITHQSKNTLLRLIYRYLDRPPQLLPQTNPKAFLVIDATWFGRENCLLVYWDTAFKKVQLWRYTNRKEAMEEITADLESLKNQGVIPAAITSDGAPGLKAALNYLYPDIPHQRCLVHLQRLAAAFLTQKPKTMAGLRLKQLTSRLNRINTQADHCFWRKDFIHWCNRYCRLLKERSSVPGGHWWYTHRYLRKTRNMLIKALPDMWHYLDDCRIPKDTNGLEGRWSGLKQHYRQHRGLSKSRRMNYLNWYLLVMLNHQLPTRNGY